MHKTLIFNWLLLVITITTTFDGNYCLKISPEKKCNTINNLGHHQYELKQHFSENIVESKSHKMENHQKIPLNVLLELNKVTSVSELFWKFMPTTNMYNVLKHISMNNIQSQSIVPKPATCTTDNQVVSLRDDDNPSLYYSPPCTRVKRCSGCCGSSLVSCQPTEVEMIDFEVTVLEYNETFTFKEKKIVTVEQHIKCKFDCIIKEQDCNPSQVYDSNECSCICNNFEDRNKCHEETGTKIWNSEICSCQCIEEQQCTTGLKFVYNTCRCEVEEE